MTTNSSPDTAFGQALDQPALALIAGPTASGKSDLAMALARALAAQGRHAVIVNADSAQVYADLAVLSAQLPAEVAQLLQRQLAHELRHRPARADSEISHAC